MKVNCGENNLQRRAECENGGQDLVSLQQISCCQSESDPGRQFLLKGPPEKKIQSVGRDFLQPVSPDDLAAVCLDDDQMAVGLARNGNMQQRTLAADAR